MNRSVHYLDHAATAFPKAPGVAGAMVRFLEHEAGNPGRGGHRMTVAASRAIERARDEIATLLGGDPERTLLGSGATFWLNTVLGSCLGPGSRVVTSALEHNAVMRPLRALERSRSVEVAVVEGADPGGVPTAAEMATAVAAATTALVVLSHASNVSGSVLPVTDIARAVAPVPVVVDGAQTAGTLPFRFRGSGLAAYACSGHKGLLGPPGTGVLLLAPDFDVEPLMYGGTGSKSESESMPGSLPDRLEAGTPNGPGIAGLGAACRWLREHDVESVHHHAMGLARRCGERLRGLPGVRLVGHDEASARIAVVSFAVGGRDAGELAARLDREHGLLLRAGLHCAPAAHRRLGSFPDGTLRTSFGPFSTDADVDALVAGLREMTS